MALDPSGSRAVAAIEAPRPDYLADADAALTVDDVQDVYRAAHAAGHLTDDLIAALKKRADAVKAEEKERASGSGSGDEGPDDEGVYTAEVVDDEAPRERAVWPAVAGPGSR
ncbi:putative protein OS=Streptomyces aurantiogriseus OX=66870 GN=GCM10010251_92200 PE=4 SV=1 [Streptomyces aurantiogriseus]